jgi:hypothetical protein
MKEQLKAGDIGLHKGTSMVSKIIEWFMGRYAKKLGIKNPRLWSHAWMFIDVWGQLYVAEADSNGINVIPFIGSSYDKDRTTWISKTPIKPYSKEEKEKVSKSAIENVFSPTRYDFFGLFYQIGKVINTKNSTDSNWGGPTGDKSERRMYCSEAVADWSNDVRPRTFDQPWAVNPLDVDLNKYYRDMV